MTSRRKRPPDTRAPVSLRPTPGFYRLRLAKGAPWVPARLWWEPQRDPPGRVLDRAHWLVGHMGTERVETRCGDVPCWPWIPISEDEYRRLLANPPANPTERPDPLTAPLPF